jgi:endoglucanase
MKKTLALILAVLIIATVFTACGGAQSEPPAASTPASEAPPSEASPPPAPEPSSEPEPVTGSEESKSEKPYETESLGEANTSANKPTALVLPDGSSDAIWTSSDPNIANVNQTGIITSRHKAGKTQIKAQTDTKIYTWEVENSVTMRDISAREFVDEIKVGLNFGPDFYYNSVAQWKDDDDYLYTSVPIAMGLYSEGFHYSILPKARVLRKGDSIKTSVRFPSMIETPKVSSLELSFQMPATGKRVENINIRINNACVVTPNGETFPVDSLNQSHFLTLTQGISDEYWVEAPFWGSVVLDMTKLSDSIALENSALEMDVEVVDAPMPDEAHWESVLGIPDNLKYFDAMKETGFNAVRINATVADYIDLDTGEICDEWFELTEELVSYITSLDMYCLLTIHDDFANYHPDNVWVGDHFDSLWLSEEYKSFIDKRFADIWRQIAEHFQYYDDYLIFQSANEPGMDEIDTDMPYKDFKALNIRRLNELNDIFVKTIRSSGGNNDKRHLNIAGFRSTPSDWSIGDLVLPEDDRITLSVHCYPASNEATSWSNTEPGDVEYADSILAFIRDFQNQTGVPVLMDEWGSSRNLDLESRINLTEYFISRTKELNVPCFYWEDNFAIGGFDDKLVFSLRYDLQNKIWQHKEIINAMMETFYS